MNACASFETLADLQKQFEENYVLKKQARALEHYSIASRGLPADREPYRLIQSMSKKRFLDQDDAEYLSKKIKKINLNWRGWAHRTKWLKEQLGDDMLWHRNSKAPLKVEQMQIDFDALFSKKTLHNIPEMPISIAIGLRSGESARV